MFVCEYDSAVNNWALGCSEEGELESCLISHLLKHLWRKLVQYYAIRQNLFYNDSQSDQSEVWIYHI